MVAARDPQKQRFQTIASDPFSMEAFGSNEHITGDNVGLEALQRSFVRIMALRPFIHPLLQHLQAPANQEVEYIEHASIAKKIGSQKYP
jgi:hypothetical protein